MDVRWLTAFIDLAAADFERTVDFWTAATESTLSTLRGDEEEFATLLPASGDPYLRVQRTADGSSGIHLDLHVGSVQAARRDSEAAGAQVVRDHGGFLAMASPGGMSFCLVGHHGEATIAPAVGGEQRHALDQVCLDIPAEIYEAECAFWQRLTGWGRHESSRFAEFSWLEGDRAMPLRILMQRLGPDDVRTTVHAHLDLACGEHGEPIATHHVARGATRRGAGKYWLDMRDPAGLSYCLTRRDAH